MISPFEEYFYDFPLVYFKFGVCVCACGGQRSALAVIPQAPPTLYFETGSCTGLELDRWTSWLRRPRDLSLFPSAGVAQLLLRFW